MNALSLTFVAGAFLKQQQMNFMSIWKIGSHKTWELHNLKAYLYGKIYKNFFRLCIVFRRKWGCVVILQ